LIYVPQSASEINLVDYTNSAGVVVTAAEQWKQLNENIYLTINTCLPEEVSILKEMVDVHHGTHKLICMSDKSIHTKARKKITSLC
jgi:hypothetical protein